MRIFGSGNTTTIEFDSPELKAMLAEREFHRIVADKLADFYISQNGQRIIDSIPEEKVMKRAIAALVVKLGGS